jgi:periplasmic protein TonB
MTENNENAEITVNVESLDELTFANRNKEYGAYFLRKKYNKYVFIAFVIAFVFISTAVVTPVILGYYNKSRVGKKEKKEVTAVIEKVFKEEYVPPPPPPPPTANVVKAVRFTAPVVVEEVVDQKSMDFATPDDVGSNDAPPENQIVTLEVEKKKDDVVQEEPVFVVVEENATFQGGDLNTFRTWVMEHTKYPESAREMGIEGRVIVQFVINSTGHIENVKVLRELDPACDQEAIRVIKSSPKWVPGKQGGRAVKQQFVLPIVFKLQNQ